MSFWEGIGTLGSSSRFEPCTRALAQLPNPIPYSFSFQTGSCDHLATFLYTYFGTPPTGPRLCLTPRPGSTEVVLQATDSSDQVSGCVRFHYGGEFERQSIHVVDAFCVRPDCRKTGLASQLLAALHVETQARGMPYSIFLKEGRLLPIAQAPLYSSSYVYRRRGLKDAPDSFKSSVYSLSPRQAGAVVRSFCALRPDTFVLWSETNPNQAWFLWKNGCQWMAACFQDAFQEIEESSSGKKERIGCLVGLFESPVLKNRQAVFEALVDASPFPWIWTDRVFLRGCEASSTPGAGSRLAPHSNGVGSNEGAGGWTADGPFHWYAYGWTTALRPGSNYILAV
jgi:hypothetical protein